MTRVIEFPLRPYTQDWPGVNTTGGETMRVGGEMADCTNVQINRGDLLEKRQGFIRALDERFNGVVCGLFVYTDDCGREWLLVADEDGISIRQPFQFTDLQTLDCYPNDGFDGEAPDEDLWRNAGTYSTSSSQLQKNLDDQETSVAEGIANALRWFKDACSTSYRVTVQFTFDETVSSRVIVVLRGNGDLTAGGLIVAELCCAPPSSSPFILTIYRRDAALNLTELASLQFASSAFTGFLTVTYDATARTVTAATTITGGNQSLTSPEIDAVSDANLGLVSAIGIGQTGPSLPTTSIQQVIGQSV